MISVSKGWKTAQTQTLLPEMFVEITYAVTEPGLQEEAVASGNYPEPFSDVSKITDTTGVNDIAYATMDYGCWGLDGSFDYLDDLYSVGIDAFSSADYYEEISLDLFKKIYIKNIELCNPDLILIYDKDKLVGFNFCYEDLLKRFYVSKTIGILKSYQKNRNIFMKLVDCSYSVMKSKGYSEVLYHFQNERTKVLNNIVSSFLIKKKLYGLLEKKYD